MSVAGAELGLLIDGVPGDSGSLGFEGAFHLSSYTIGLTIPLDGTQTIGRVRSEILVQGEFDSALPQLARKLAQGDLIGFVKLRALSPASGVSRPVVQYKFTDVIIGSLVDTAAYGGDELRVSYGGVKISSRGHGGASESVGYGYNFATARGGPLGAAEIDFVESESSDSLTGQPSPIPDLNADAKVILRGPKKKRSQPVTKQKL